MSAKPSDIINFSQPTEKLMIGGQPTPQQLAAVAAAGVRHVITLRPDVEDPGFDEAGELDDLGLSFRRIPVAGEPGLTRDAVAALDTALGEIGDEPVLVHCASANRVGALFALRAAWLQGKSVDEALSEGRATGLRAMEPAVRRMIED